MKKTALLLLLCLLVPIAVSCARESGTVNDTAAAEISDTAVAETTEYDYYPAIPTDADFNGEEFRTLMPNWSLYMNFYFADEETGDTVNDTIFERTMRVEEELNIDVTYSRDEYVNETHTLFQNTVLAGEDIYDLFLTHVETGILTYISERYVCDWNDIPYVDMDMPYWNESARECIEYNGIVPLAASSFIIPDVNSLFYNKDMHENYSLDPLYPIIDSGEWTWDVLIEMASVVTADLNGDSVMDDNDQYGYLGELSWQSASIVTGCDQYVVTKDAEGVRELSINTEKMINIVDKMYYLFRESGFGFTWPFSQETDPNKGGKPPVSFDSGRGLFYMVPLSLASYFRTTEVDFGIIPMPKYDEAQENYRSLNWAGYMGVPMTAQSTEMIGMAVELLSYYNDKLVMPVFYDVLLGQKIARDEESVRMLDMIFDNTVYDLGINFGLYRFLYETVGQGGDFVSYYESKSATALSYVDDFMEALEAYAG